MKIYTVHSDGKWICPRGWWDMTVLRCFSCGGDDLKTIFDDPTLWTMCKEAIVNDEKIEAFQMRLITYECRECGDPLHRKVTRSTTQLALFPKGKAREVQGGTKE